MEPFKGYWACPNGCRLLSELRTRHHNFYRFLLKTSFQSLFSFTFVTFFIHLSLSPAASSVSWCHSCFVCSGLTYEIYSGGGPSTYIYCMVCYQVIAAPYVRSAVMSLHTVALLMSIQNAQWTMSSLYSLKCFFHADTYLHDDIWCYISHCKILFNNYLRFIKTDQYFVNTRG